MSPLFLSEIYFYRYASEAKFFPELVFRKAFVRLFYVLRKVAEEYKLWRWRRQLHAILYLDVFPFDCRRWVVLNNRQHHLIEFASRDTLSAVVVHSYSSFYRFVS